MATTTEFYKIIKEAAEGTEDHWRLVVNDDGAAFVEHDWSRVNAYPGKPKKTKIGTKVYPLQDFLAGDSPANAKSSLKLALRSKGLSKLLPDFAG
jgi:hypothetical protein